jgi:hypothetical protein
VLQRQRQQRRFDGAIEGAGKIRESAPVQIGQHRQLQIDLLNQQLTVIKKIKEPKTQKI